MRAKMISAKALGAVGLLSMILGFGALTGQDKEAVVPKKHFKFLDRYCLDCHDTDTQKGKVDLENLDFLIKKPEQADLWQKVLNAMNAGEMPPEKKKQPTKKEKTDFLDDLSNTMVVARKVLSDSGGEIAMRRLNRREYLNSVEALIGIRPDENSIADDASSGGFDTAGSAMFMSGDQIENYLGVARESLDEAFIQRSSERKKATTIRVEPEKTVRPIDLKRIKDLEKRKVNLAKWKAEVDKAYKDPRNAKSVAQLRKKGLLDKQKYREADSLKFGPDSKKYGFRDAFSAAGSSNDVKNYLPLYQHYESLPKASQGIYLKLGMPGGAGITRIDVSSKKMVPGTYKLRIRAGAITGAPDNRKFLEVGHPQQVSKNLKKGFDSHPISSHQVLGTVSRPQTIETLVSVNSKTIKTFSVRQRQPIDEAAQFKTLFHVEKKKNGYGYEPAVWVDWVELEGPIKLGEPKDTLSRLLKEVKQQSKPEPQKAKHLLVEFAKVAFRGKSVEADYVESLVGIFQKQRKKGESFDIAIRTPLSIILASPSFLYMNEPGKDADRRELSDRELAVRLAYFLWSSPPDETLLGLAKEEKLKNSSTLREQVSRMLKDPRSDAFVSGFVHQWLDMERLDFFQFDIRKYREFDESARSSARQEVYENFAYLMRNGSSGRLDQLLKSDYVMVNGLMAEHYGIKGVKGEEFKRVKVPRGSPRGGLLGMAAIHAMGSDGHHSSPVERGAWVLRHLMNNPPPPAPANVPQLSRLEGEVLTTKQRLKAHQEEPQCLSCHRKIDPVGFALENFDAIGKWRDTQKIEVKLAKKERQALLKKDPKVRKLLNQSLGIDVSGAFFNGPSFKDFYEFRDHLMKGRTNFAQGFTEDLVEYALGRPFAFSDQDLAEDVMSAAKKKNYAVSSFIMAVVESQDFQSK